MYYRVLTAWDLCALLALLAWTHAKRLDRSHFNWVVHHRSEGLYDTFNHKEEFKIEAWERAAGALLSLFAFQYTYLALLPFLAFAHFSLKKLKRYRLEKKRDSRYPAIVAEAKRKAALDAAQTAAP